MFEKYITEDYQIKWDYVESIHDFAILKQCEQNPKWHSEGTAWQHTVKCVEAAQKIISSYQELTDWEKRILLVSVLFHDIGKGVTTEFFKGNWHAYGHEVEGEKIARRILWDEDFTAREFVCSMIRWHMEVLRIADAKDYINKLIKFSCIKFFSWKLAILVKTCDCLGSLPENKEQTNIDTSKLGFLKRACVDIGCLEHSPFSSNVEYRRFFGKEINWSNPSEDDGKQHIYVMIGLPGAGKDTYVKRFLSDRNAVVLCRDDIRAELGFCNQGDKIVGTKEQEYEVTKIFFDRFIFNIKNGKNIVLNNLNLKKDYRIDYHKKFESIFGDKNRIIWEYVYIEAPTLQDNINRREGQIPDTAFLTMIEKFDWPTIDEYDEFIYIKQNNN